MFLETPKPTTHPALVILRRAVVVTALVICLIVVGIILCNLWICGSTQHDVYEKAENVPKHKVALVLGTSKLFGPNTPNPHFANRVKAAAALLAADKVEHILVSGDNRTDYYNEPRDLRESLIELGVPPDRITCDFAGLRTLDSVIRAKEVFGQNEFVIVSDDFHVNRALFIAKARGIDAIGLQSEPVPFRQSQKSRSREWFARVKAILDLHILGTEPRHYGDPVVIGETTPTDSEPVASPAGQIDSVQ